MAAQERAAACRKTLASLATSKNAALREYAATWTTLIGARETPFATIKTQIDRAVREHASNIKDQTMPTMSSRIAKRILSRIARQVTVADTTYLARIKTQTSTLAAELRRFPREEFSALADALTREAQRSSASPS
ncbi:hypothetical protein JCM18899A_40630 [Nocardioides sp. AN3]